MASIMDAAATKDDYHYVLLAELGLTTGRHKQQQQQYQQQYPYPGEDHKAQSMVMSSQPRVDAFDVLHLLLQQGLLSAADVRNAHRQLHQQEGRIDSEKDQVQHEHQIIQHKVEPMDKVVESKGQLREFNSQQQERQKCPPNPKGSVDVKPFQIDHQQKTSDANQFARRQRHIALKIYYDGGSYTGLAEHVGFPHDRSIEKALFEALQKAHLINRITLGADDNYETNEKIRFRETIQYSRCGRTDKGVSSAGQVLAMKLFSAFSSTATSDSDGMRPIDSSHLPGNSHDTVQVWEVPKSKMKRTKKTKHVIENTTKIPGIDPCEDHDNPPARQLKTMSEYAYDKILNNLLPPEIRVLGWTPVSDKFSARFSATNRTYRYFFLARPGVMDLDRIRTGLTFLVGKHDFRNFCKMDVEKVYNFERQIFAAELIVEDEGTGVCYLQIVGQAFLWHQIRCIASVIFMVGHGLEEPSIVKELLNVEMHPGKPAYPLAPERSLVLHGCGYPYVSFGYSTINVWGVLCHQEQQWENLILAAARIRNCINHIKDHAMIAVTDLMAFCTMRLNERVKKRRRERYNETQDAVQMPEPPFDSAKLVTVGQALHWMNNSLGLIPGPHQIRDTVHVPLLERSTGTTYEEKVASIQNTTKRRQKYEQNVIKKRQTKEEDDAFYTYMTEQGGAATR